MKQFEPILTLVSKLSAAEAEIRAVEDKRNQLTAELERLSTTAEPDDDQVINTITALRTRLEMIPGAIARRNATMEEILGQIESEFQVLRTEVLESIAARSAEARSVIAERLKPFMLDSTAEVAAKDIFTRSDKPAMVTLRNAAMLAGESFGYKGESGHGSDLPSAVKLMVKCAGDAAAIKF